MLRQLHPADLHLLRVFQAVARHRGFTAAEAALGINQSTISSHVKKLEARLGMQLCVRGRGGFQLTGAGERVLFACRDLERRLDGFVATVAGINDAVAGQVRIGIPHVTSRIPQLGGLPVALARLRRGHPDLHVAIELDSQRAIEAGVLEGRFDLAVTSTRFRPRHASLIPLFEVPARLYCARTHPLYTRPDTAITAATLAGYPAVVHVHDAAAQRPFDIARALVTESSEVAVFYILSGEYIGYLSDYVAAYWQASGELRALRPDTWRYVSPGGLVVLNKRLATPRVKSVVDAIAGVPGGD